MKLKKLIFAALGIVILNFIVFISERMQKPSSFIVTPNTKIIPNSELSKYVTQEEVDDFAFRYWDIDKQIKDDLFAENFRKLLKSKQTDKILKFMSDNNISANTPVIDGVTPLMYASFYDDENTAKKLIDMGANPHAKDLYKLSPLAYAIENNSTKTAKLLLDSGVKVEDVGKVQSYIDPPFYHNIEKLIIYKDDIKIIFEDNYGVDMESKDPTSPMEYIVSHNYVTMAELILDSGYKPKLLNTYAHFTGIKDQNSTFLRSLYTLLDSIPNHEPMLELLLKYDVIGQPTKEELKSVYKECYRNLKYFTEAKEHYIYEMNLGRDKEGEARLEKTNRKYKDAPYTHMYKDGLLTYKPQPLDPKIMKGYHDTINFYTTHCPDENGTFKDTRDFIKWANEREKKLRIEKILRVYQNDPTKVIYVDANMSELDKEKLKSKKLIEKRRRMQDVKE